MSPKQATILSPKQRREVIRENILSLNYEKIAALCHCTKRTIKRDVHQWRLEGGFEQFLMDEFLRSYPNIKKEFPDKAFDRLCFLLGKTLTRKVEMKEEIKIREKVDVTILAEYVNALDSAMQRDIQALRARKQMDTAKP